MIQHRRQLHIQQSRRTHSLMNLLPRGGATTTSDESTTTPTNINTDTNSVTPSKKKKKKKNKKKNKTKKKKKPNEVIIQQESKNLINDKLKDEDSAAQSLGDAIRQNAHLLLNRHHDDDDDYDDDAVTARTSLQSLGYAMGSSDYTTMVLSQYNKQQRQKHSTSSRTKGQMAQDLTSPTAVIAHYFLKSHGGVHLIQCICSGLASLAGMASLVLSHQNPAWQSTLIRRTLFFGMCKHLSGVLMAIYLVARTIQSGGFPEASQSIQSLIRDPISQYVFYTACVFVWLPTSSTRSSSSLKATTIPPAAAVDAGSIASTITSSVGELAWWQSYSGITLLLVGPVVIREFISIALVVSDVLTLMIATTAGSDTATTTTTYIEQLLKVMQALVDAGMSLLVTPKKWRSSNAVQRQAILARLVSKISLLMEIGVGMLMLCDCLITSMRYLFVNTGGQVRFYTLVKSLICTRLYIGFLWTRRNNINKLVEAIRGGAIEMPIYVLDVILHPSSSMGIDSQLSSKSRSTTTTTTGSTEQSQDGNQMETKPTLLDFFRIALDMDNP